MPWLAFIQGVWSIATSRFGNICIAFLVGSVWANHKANVRWEAVIAAEKAAAEIAYQKEIARQAQVSQEIAAAATQRAEDDMALEAALREQINDLKNAEQSNAPTHTITREKVVNSCSVDDDLARRMRQLDATARQARATRAARKVR